MKRAIFLLLFISNISVAIAQKNTISKSWYARVMPFSLSTIPIYSSTGTSSASTVGKIDTVTLKDRIIQSLEVGYSYGIIDAGLCLGTAGKSTFVEGRITIDGFQVGNFSNEFTIGGGYVNGPSPIMLEASSTIMLQVAQKIGIGVVTGYYDFAGNKEDVSRTYFGLFLRYGLLRSSDGTLLSKIRKVRHRATF